MSELREAAQAVLNDYERGVSFVVTERVIARLRAALAEPEAEPEPVAWQARHIGRGEPYGEWRTIQWETLGCTDLVPAMVDSMRQRQDYEMRPLYAHPPRNEWRKAVLGALEICMILNEANRDDPERAMSDLMGWEPRDEWRPASEPPDSDRDVQAWIKIDLSELDGVVTEQCEAQAFYEDGVWHVRGPDHDGWMQLCPGHMVSVVVWRDVTPPTTEGE